VARHLTENLARDPDVRVHILADAADHRRVVHNVGHPWTDFDYHLFESDTSAQQARWVFTASPKAELFWPEADVVYCTAESYVPTRSKRLAVTVHDAALFEKGAHEWSYQLSTQRWKWRLLYAILSRRADMFHTVSHYSADRLGHYFPLIRSRLRVVHNAPPDRFFEPVSAEGEQFVERAGLHDVPYILVPGGLHFRKNAEIVLDAWPLLREKLPGYKLIVVGHSQASYAARARALGSDVMLTGFVHDEALCSLYHRARCVWFPSQYEGFGIPILEAMACSAPVVASDCTAIPEVAGNAAVLVPPHIVHRHVEAIEAVCESSELRTSLVARGLARVKHFTWKASAAQLVSNLRSIV
jgi:glycosyltransferase involved in cell wall biosynthesis